MLPKDLRLRREKEINYVLKRGNRKSTGIITLVFARLSNPVQHFGFLVSKKISNKTSVRNLIKRRMRHAVANLIQQIDAGVAVLFIAKPPIIKISYKQIEENIVILLSKASLLKK